MYKSLPHQQVLTRLPFAIVILRAKTNSFQDTHPLMPEVVRRLGEFKPGHVYVIAAR